jgi:hypothetical protein
MATQKWGATWTSRGTVLTTEIDSLVTAGYSAASASYDNSTNFDQYGYFSLKLASYTPTAGATWTFFLLQSLDGTNFEDAPSSTNPGTGKLSVTITVNAAASAKLENTQPFLMPPGKFKVVALNNSGATTTAGGGTANTLTLYTTNLAVN